MTFHDICPMDFTDRHTTERCDENNINEGTVLLELDTQEHARCV